MKHFIYLVLFSLASSSGSLIAQIVSFPYSESFDGMIAPALPKGWSANGFIDTASTAHSSPNCILSKGNVILKTLTSPTFDFTNRVPDKLAFYEYRSNTAKYYRLEIRVSTDGVNFNTLMVRFDSISPTSNYIHRIVNLPGSELQNQPNVKFRWQLLGDSTNSTGILRLDDISLTVMTGFDAGITRITVSPFNATRRDSLTLYSVVKNYGVLAISGFSVRYFYDENFDGIAEPLEQFTIIDGLSLRSGDSLTCTATHAPVKAGEHRFITTVDFQQDENHSNDTARSVVIVGYVKNDLLVNEIMYAPTGDEPEWVELFNESSDTVNLKNWRISDKNVSTKSLISQNDIFVPPSSYQIVAKDINFFILHPGVSALIASFAALNNSTPDAVVFFDPQLTTIDSVMYAPSWGGQNGKSLERIDLCQPSTSVSNWGTSQDSLGSTPGRINSIARLDYDLSFQRLCQVSLSNDSNVTPILNAVVQNVGKLTIDSVIVRFYTDSNHNTVPELSELQHTSVSPYPLAPFDSVVFSESFPQLAAGQIDIIAVIDSWRDERLRNNRAVLTLTLSFEPSSIVINEIMYDPPNGQNEWLELFNRSNRQIDIAHWTFNDRPTVSGSINSFVITNQTMIVKPSDYVIVAAEPSLLQLLSNSLLSNSSIHTIVLNRPSGFGFNNDGDAVILKDLTGKTIDSILYQPGWGGQNGKSLERIDVDVPSTAKMNWGTSQDSLGCTPGRMNSIIRLNYDVAVSNLTQTQTVGGGKIDPVLNVVIQNVGKRTVDTVIVRFYANSDHDGVPDSSELLRSVLSNKSVVAGDSILISESFPQLSSGETNIIVVTDYWRDERLCNNQMSITVKVGYEPRSLIINEIMYDPLEGQNEWFELYNRSNIPVDISQWFFADRPTTSGKVDSFKIVSHMEIIKPGEYVVIAADSTLLRFFTNLIAGNNNAHLFILNRTSGFSFNNDGDAIVLKDLTSKTIDSVTYSQHWHHPDVVDTRGRSLERINPNIDSNDPRNWSTCTNILGGTPGKANSVMTTSAPSGATVSISPNPFSPDGDGFEDFCIIRYNLPMMTSTMNIRIYDIKGRLIRTLANGELAGLHGEIVWDGLGDDKQRARIGVYVIFLEANDRSSGKVVTAKAVAVVATKL